MLTWAAANDLKRGAGIFCFLDSQGYPAGIEPAQECLLAVGTLGSIEAPAGDAFPRLKAWARDRGDWVFGNFGYDLAAETEPPPGGGAPEARPDPIGFPDLFFFVPEVVLRLNQNVISIGSFQGDQEAIWARIRASVPGPAAAPKLPGGGNIPPFTANLTKEAYLEKVAALQRHIHRGDCYEVNFCLEFHSRPADLDPLAAWWSLSEVSPNPFSCLYRLGDRWLLSASPERYLKKTGDRIWSQPIKGTAARCPGQPEADQAARDRLLRSEKDRSENVMVVDLVRNDLSRVCLPGSVTTEELYGVYPFPQVWQLISTVSGLLAPGVDWPDTIAATFPMGSMTGAPKNEVVRLINRYETQKRGIFSGAVGYVNPAGDFDFNVVIRSLLYQRGHQYLSYQVGSGITVYSDPAAEYEECLVKASGILRALGMD